MSTSRASEPQVIAVDPAGIPAELRDTPRWVAWRYVQRDGKWTKPPVDAHNGGAGDSTNPNTWAAFDTALAYAQSHNLPGVGLALGPDLGIVAIDLDHCREPTAGELESWARVIIEALPAYWEASPSGTGVRGLVRAVKPEGRCRKGDVEMYDRGRYVTITGHRLPESADGIPEAQAALTALHRRLFPPRESSTPVPPATGSLDDAALVEKAIVARNGDAFRRLWEGDAAAYDNDESRADLALMSHLCFWTGADEERMERLFGQSALGQRSKWLDRPDYRDRTIRAALVGGTDGYKPTVIPSVNGRRNGGATADKQTPSDFNATDAGNGELLAHLYGSTLRYDHRRARWLVWTDHRWRPDAEAHVRQLAIEAARKRYAAAPDIDDLKRREAAAKWAIQSESRARVGDALYLAQSMPPISDPGGQWDVDPWLLGVVNGVVDLRTGELRPGRVEDRITMSSAVVFDPDAKAPRWEQFLEEIFDGDTELVGFIQRALGYSLTGRTSEQCLFMLWGSGENGKSTLLRTVRQQLGDYAANTRFAALQPRAADGPTNELAALAGKRLITASEINEGGRLNEALAKGWTGEDDQTARFLYAEPFTFRPEGKLWLGVNHKPVVKDDSVGFWRKVRLIPFTRRIESPDKTLADKLQAEAEGILSSMVRGCLAWQQEGLDPPAVVKAATDDYREEQDTLAAFLAECCVTGDSEDVAAGDLYGAYAAWAEGNLSPRERMSLQMFGRRIGARFASTRDPRHKTYIGLALRQ